jgi:hypothetical protein
LVVAFLLSLSVTQVFVFLFFVLKEKSRAKKFKASPNRSARLAAQAQHHSASFRNLRLLIREQHLFLLLQLFQKLIAGLYLCVTRCRRCIPLCCSYNTIMHQVHAG